MDTRLFERAGHGLLREWVTDLVASARRNGVNGDPVPVRGWLSGAMLIACVRKLGGTVRPDEPFFGWILNESLEDCEGIRAAAPELTFDGVRIGDFHGVVLIELHGESFVALRTDEPLDGRLAERTLVLAGPSLDSTMRLAARLAATRREILQDSHVQLFGVSRRLFSPREIAEDDLILPERFKRDLLSFVDGFARAADVCRRLRVTPSRGALFVGAPGTGKTQTVRHLFGRLRGFRHYVLMETDGKKPETARLFEAMLERIIELGEPAVVVIEDIDRLFEMEAVTPHFFLNVLDGLFQPTQPVLWIATSNDPRGLEANVLDRPGRFDRVFVFPPPGPEERRQFLRRYAAWQVDTQVLDELARDSEGLTGAHIREVCYAAALDAAEDPVGFAAALGEQLRKVRSQHQRARSYDFDLGPRRLGFGA